jgi:iron(III) transport system substrate-binding protein
VSHALPPDAAYRDLAVATTCEPLVTLTRDASAPAGSPSELAALLASDPARFRGRIAVPDIETNGLGFLAMLRWSEAPGFDAFLDALASCAPRAVGSAPALVSSVADGGSLALHLLGSYASRATASDATLHIAPSSTPSIAVSRVAFIPRRATNPEAAAAFLAYMLSDDGQAALGDAGLFPIAAPPTRPRAPIPLDDSFARLIDPAIRTRLLTCWRKAIGRNDTTGGFRS